MIVPFDPARVFETAPARIGCGKHEGYAVRGTAAVATYEPGS